MKTSVIRYRVADFLKQHSPFNEVADEDLLSLAASGRVIFHESEEYVFRKNQPCGPAIWVIQQGGVALIDENPQGERLRDLLGEGDILGSERLLGNALYRYSARTTSDVILYSIDAEQFAKVVAGNASVARYLSAQFSIPQSDEEAGASPEMIQDEAGDKQSWLDAAAPPSDFLRRQLLSVRPGVTVQQAAAKMVEGSSDWIAVVDKQHKPLGIITTRELRNHLAKGASADSPVKAILSSHLATSLPDLSTGAYFLEMMKARCQALAITADGTPHSALQGVVTDSDLSLISGNNPALLLARALEASTVEDWRRLLQQEERMLASALTAPAKVDVCAQLTTEFLHAMVESVLRQTESELSRAGSVIPPLPYCWLLFGHAGRSEAVVPFQPEIGVVYRDGPESPDAKIYYSAVLKKVASYFTECGLRVPSGSAAASGVTLCHSLSEWKKSFQSRIADPIGSFVHRGRALFDFQPLFGERSLVDELRQTILSTLALSGPFIPVMANDTLSNLPPLTFFHGLVVELDGAQRETLDIESTALAPITDAARVFALATGNLEVTSTLSRLEGAAVAFPDHATVFHQAAQAFRITTYQRAVATFNGQGEDALIRPSILNRYDQRLLKTAFDAIQRLLELSSATFDVAA